MKTTEYNGRTWEEQIYDGIFEIEDIKEIFHFTDEETKELQKITARYPIRIPPYYLSLINPEDQNDPIRKMCVPTISEFLKGGEEDTSGEADNTVVQGMQHKYRQTALILSSNRCAMYCRHCFRKRMVGYSVEEVAQRLPVMIDYVKRHTEINNVLISGGDSFMNSNEIIRRYLEYFCEIPSIDFIRFGTRIPVVLPQKISENDELLDLLKTYCEKKQIIIVTQFNHPRELTQESVEAISSLKKSGCIVRNQTVLLKGVNNNADVLAELMNKLAAHGVIPYYVFQCRPVVGVKNQFQVPLIEGVDIIDHAKRKMNGQAKSFKYVMSHPSGKIEIVGNDGSGKMVFKYHQAKTEIDQSKIFTLKVDVHQCWVENIES